MIVTDATGISPEKHREYWGVVPGFTNPFYKKAFGGVGGTEGKLSGSGRCPPQQNTGQSLLGNGSRNTSDGHHPVEDRVSQVDTLRIDVGDVKVEQKSMLGRRV